MRANEIQFDDGAEYFLKLFDNIWQENFVPSQDDILNVRIKTTGLKEINFPMKNFLARVVDVGGQRNERRKWIHCFQDVTTILFIVALIE